MEGLTAVHSLLADKTDRQASRHRGENSRGSKRAGLTPDGSGLQSHTHRHTHRDTHTPHPPHPPHPTPPCHWGGGRAADTVPCRWKQPAGYRYIIGASCAVRVFWSHHQSFALSGLTQIDVPSSISPQPKRIVCLNLLLVLAAGCTTVVAMRRRPSSSSKLCH